MSYLVDLVAELMVWWHQRRRETHRRAERKWRARLLPDTTISFPPVETYRAEQKRQR